MTNLIPNPDDWKQRFQKLAELIVRHCSHVAELLLPVSGVHSSDTLKLLAPLTSLRSLTVNSKGGELGPHAKVSAVRLPVYGPDAVMHYLLFSRCLVFLSKIKFTFVVLNFLSGFLC